MDAVKNLVKVTVSTGYDAAVTSVVLAAGHGAKLPNPAVVNFNLTWWNFTDYSDPADDPNVEIVRVTALSTDTITVTRGQESISATTKNTAGKTYKMILGVTAKMINDIMASIPSSPTWASLAQIGIQLRPLAATFPATAYPQLTKNVGTNKTDFTLDFDKDAIETAEWEVLIPYGTYQTSAILYIVYRCPAATSGAVIFQVATSSLSDSQAWDAAADVTDVFSASTVPTTAGGPRMIACTLTVTTWGPTDTLHIKIQRKATDANDTLAEDCKLMNALLIISP